MTGHYLRPDHGFQYFENSQKPAWRPPQLGALGALFGHWTVHEKTPVLLSLPTGAGKTAIATAVPYLAGAKRVLVLVPSTQLRSQLARAFASQVVLREIGAVTGNWNPTVHELKGMAGKWQDLSRFDVVVALPAAISPAQHETNPPPADLFDLVIVDEAHHAPAPTWRAILDHYSEAHRVLLTATPKRRDRRRVPGEIAYHYPVARAIADGFYKAVIPEILQVTSAMNRDDCDRAIATRVIELFQSPEHESSSLLIRVGRAERAHTVAQIYRELGLDPVVLLSSLSDRTQEQIIAGLQDRTIRAVVVVGMLGEGFDLPSLRLAAYHDKHKSLSSTVQLIGRLVRADERFPQPSVLMTVDDKDTYPELKGAVRALYDEDAEWSGLLPGIIDSEIAETIADHNFSARLEASPPDLSVDALRPLVRATIHEVADPGWSPDLENLRAANLSPGAILRGGHEVFYSSVLPGGVTLVVVTQHLESPRWHRHSGLDSVRFDLHLVTFRSPRHVGEVGLLMANSDDGEVRRALLAALETPISVRAANPDRLHHLFDSLARVSVSNVGVRSTQLGGRGTTSYRTFAGSRVDRGIRESDTSNGAIGHAMAQISRGPGESAYTVGIAVEKSKIWESRYVSLRGYDEIVSGYAAEYWSASAVADPLLPAVSRGSRVTNFPASEVIVAELDVQSLEEGWATEDGRLLSDYVLAVEINDSRTQLTISLWDPTTGEATWTGHQSADGEVTSAGTQLNIHRGYGTVVAIDQYLTDRPLTIFFRNSSTVHGGLIYERPGVQKDISRIVASRPDWAGTNIAAETDATALKAGSGISVQAFVAAELTAQPSFYSHRWIIHNDGGGEIADIFSIELNPTGDVRLQLWHVKPSGGAQPAARVTDLEVIVAQAIKSRRWFSDPEFWQLVLRRLDPGAAPRARVLDGDEDLLRRYLGPATAEMPWTLDSGRPVIRGGINIVQPGLSWNTFASRLQNNDQSAIQIRDLLTAFDDAVSTYAETSIMCSG